MRGVATQLAVNTKQWRNASTLSTRGSPLSRRGLLWLVIGRGWVWLDWAVSARRVKDGRQYLRLGDLYRYFAAGTDWWDPAFVKALYESFVLAFNAF